MADQVRFSRRTALQAAMGGLALSVTAALPAATPTQTAGPFFPKHDQADKDLDLTRIEGHAKTARGEVIVVEGRVLDEQGQPVAEALVDVWQANMHGRYAHEADTSTAPLDPDFQGWARLRTDADGRFRVRTIKPGAYPVQANWSRPPHIHFKVARRGFHELTTQMYFAGDALNDIDRLLLAVPEADRPKLVVAFTDGVEGAKAGTFEIVLRRA
ncbi:MAG: protocatechuate 3,4-dioxygenase [Lysobacter sp.]|nr:protocatechuate 3,4-dioxygenase [Lysobacter sp.]